MTRYGNVVKLPSFVWQHESGEETGDPATIVERVDKMSKRLRARVPVGRDDTGRPVYKWASAQTKKELKEEVERIRREYAADTVESLKKQNTPPPELLAAALEESGPKGITFGEYAQRWYMLYKRPHVRQSTRDMYENVFKKHLFPAFANMPLKAIRADELQAFILTYADMSSSLIDKIMLALRQVFAAAVDDDIIPKSPVGKMKPPEGSAGERLPLSMAEVDEMTKAAKDRESGLLPLLLCYAGLRRGEALGLRWEDIDGDYINVRRAVVYCGKNRAGLISETKTKAGVRRVPILPILAERLKKGGRGFVVTGERIWPYTTFKRRWEGIQREIEALQGVSPHRLRHTYLMLLRRAGVDPVTQQYLMGHSDYETTANDYTHIEALDVQEARARMLDLLPDLLPHAQTALKG